jgi:23S rRNA (cytidine2498-2'-O)-methyltransferase
LKSTFARTSGIGLGKITNDNQTQMVQQLVDELPLKYLPTLKHVHVWQRDPVLPGNRDFEPGRNELTDKIASEIAQTLQSANLSTDTATTTASLASANRIAKADEAILDVIMVEPDQWWFGWHQATTTVSRWPGGIYSIRLPEHAVSRAYLKMAEALQWARLPIAEQDLVAEIGSAPGGSSQMLLENGFQVIGIDPAQMHANLIEHPKFTHVRKKVAGMRRSGFRNIKWIMSDANATPTYTLDSVEHIVTRDDVYIRGMLLTLKLTNWELAKELPQYLDRIRSWGYQYIRTRQLAFNRREICVAVMKSRAIRRIKRHRKKSR